MNKKSRTVRYLALLMLLCVAGCQADGQKSKYLRWVEDIEHDELVDGAEFQLCHDELYTRQYFNFLNGLQYEGERPAIYREFETNYKQVAVDQSGFVRIRFVVNCNGDTGRFRIIMADENYEGMEFDERIIDQLVDITKSLDGWLPQAIDEKYLDYYQYLLFKIEKGAIVEILP